MYYNIEYLPEEVLIELYYELQKDIDRQKILEYPLWFESITKEDFLFKAQSIDTDKEELEIRVLLNEVLKESEKETIKNLYKADKGKLKNFKDKLENVVIEKRTKEIINGEYKYLKTTLPVFIKTIDSIEVDLIVTFNTAKVNKELLSIILAAGQAGVERAYKDANIPNPFDLSVSNFAKYYKDRARKFSESVSDNVQSRIRAEVITGIKEGEGANKIATRIREAYKKPIEVTVAATKTRPEYTRLLDNRYWSNMVAQTETSWAANQGRLDAYKETDLVKNVEWLTAYNPCIDCESFRGKIFTLEEVTGMIPMHPHCHCTYKVNEYKERTEKNLEKGGPGSGRYPAGSGGQKEEPIKEEKIREISMPFVSEDDVGNISSVNLERARINYEQVKETLKEIPQEHLDNIKEIRMSSHNEIAELLKEENKDWSMAECLERATKNGAIISPDSKLIRLNANTTVPEFLDNNMLGPKGIITHEIGHNVYDKTVDEISDNILQESMNTRVDVLFFGNETSPSASERFAGLYRLYVTQPRVFQIAAPSIYKMMKEKVFKDKEYIKNISVQIEKVNKNINIYEYRLPNLIIYSSEKILELEEKEIVEKGGPGSGRHPEGGRKEEPKKSKEERRGGEVAVGTYDTPAGVKIVLTVDGEKMRNYIDKVKEMKDCADMIVDATTESDTTTIIQRLTQELSKLDSERSTLHNDMATDAMHRIVAENPTLNDLQVYNAVRQSTLGMANKIITHQ